MPHGLHGAHTVPRRPPCPPWALWLDHRPPLPPESPGEEGTGPHLQKHDSVARLLPAVPKAQETRQICPHPGTMLLLFPLLSALRMRTRAGPRLPLEPFLPGGSTAHGSGLDGPWFGADAKRED